MPQAVNNGAAMIGLTAWHLYPDMAIFGNKTVEVYMKDKLIATGGVLTLGFSHPPHGMTPGIHWSLSLARLRHYGHPVSSVGLLSSDPNRLSFRQLQVTTIGAILGHWRVSPMEISPWVEVLHKIGQVLGTRSKGRKIDRWIDMLVDGTSLYLQAKGYAKDLVVKLVNLGRKRSSDFLPHNSEHRFISWPFFRLLEINSILACMKGPQERILFLRHIAARIPRLDRMPTILRLLPEAQVPHRKLYSKHSKFGSENAAKAEANLESLAEASYATAIPGFPNFLGHHPKYPCLIINGCQLQSHN